ncbi:AAA family ATPase [Methanobrevibacter sp. DSM 116169]|uniref:AAA family ATPase n=1 Tax=Methanobrevibacter sp. DSM 116169 TaxID=3242727 RepID=UPI0038FC631D
MNIIGVSGLPGSGKSLVSDLAIEKGGTIVSMGDIIREEAIKRDEDSQTTAVKLREEFGQYIVAEMTIEKIKTINDTKLIVVEGIRSPYEVKLFKDNFPTFKLISIFANRVTRFERLQNRKRADDSSEYEEFLKRDERELNFGIGQVIAESDKIFINEDNLDSFKKELNNYLDTIILK